MAAERAEGGAMWDAGGPRLHVLALDQATRRIGFAIGSHSMVAPLTGVYELPKVAKTGEMLMLARNWLDATIKTYHVTKVAYEGSFIGPNRRAFGTVNKLIGIIELTCDDHEIGCVEVFPHEWRKRFLGRVTAPKDIERKDRRWWLKLQAMRACAARQWDVKNDDEADACGILDFILAQDSASYQSRWRPIHEQSVG